MLQAGAMRVRTGLILITAVLIPTALFAAGLSFQAVKKEIVE